MHKSKSNTFAQGSHTHTHRQRERKKNVSLAKNGEEKKLMEKF